MSYNPGSNQEWFMPKSPCEDPFSVSGRTFFSLINQSLYLNYVSMYVELLNIIWHQAIASMELDAKKSLGLDVLNSKTFSLVTIIFISFCFNWKQKEEWERNKSLDLISVWLVFLLDLALFSLVIHQWSFIHD